MTNTKNFLVIIFVGIICFIGGFLVSKFTEKPQPASIFTATIASTGSTIEYYSNGTCRIVWNANTKSELGKTQYDSNGSAVGCLFPGLAGGNTTNVDRQITSVNNTNTNTHGGSAYQATDGSLGNYVQFLPDGTCKVYVNMEYPPQSGSTVIDSNGHRWCKVTGILNTSTTNQPVSKFPTRTTNTQPATN